MTPDETAKIIEVTHMMEALGFQFIKQEDTDLGVEITFRIPRAARPEVSSAGVESAGPG